MAYFTPFSDPVTESFKKLYPAAFVGAKPVSIEDSDEFINLAAKMDPSANKADVYNNFIHRNQQHELLSKLGIKLESDAVSDEKQFYLSGNEDAYNEFIKTYFKGKEELFVQSIVEPEVVESKLQIYYNADHNLNSEAYAKAQDILNQLNSGSKFEELAKQYSDDKQTGQLGGDLGFFKHGQILPELEKQLSIVKVGEVYKQIIATRNGYEIIYPVEVSQQNGQKLWHAKHIVIQTTGFDDWLTKQLATISVTKLKRY
jgi:parvulin-like peptidyl-prolyl isomerase